MSSADTSLSTMSDTSSGGVFRDFDQSDVFKECREAVLSVKTGNFVLKFNDASAECALDVNLEGIREILDTEPSGSTRTKWINIWRPEKQKDILEEIAKRYNFSPRLAGLMQCEPMRPVPAPTTPQSPSRIQEFLHTGHSRTNSGETNKGMELKVVDLEGHSTNDERKSHLMEPLDLNHYSLVNQVWHYSSVDWGHKFLCLGYNSLHHTVASLSPNPDSTENNEDRPAGKRVWTWLVLCDNETVITVHENPFPNHDLQISEEEQKNLENIRRNLWIVFSQISTLNNIPNPMMNLPLRSPKLKKDDTPHAYQSDVPSLLFYYLFDDWYASYSLVSRSEHQYGKQLEQLRKRMFSTAELKHITQLHQYGRQLAVLKRMYQSYDNIIQRVLEGPQDIPPSVPRSTAKSSKHTQSESTATEDSVVAPSTSYGVPLSTAAKLKFERLNDRVKLLTLTEIQDCLDEKEALVMLNFNLIAIKESSAVERLARITILLAKVTILFMPVSLMTAYFSVQIEDLAGVYTHVTYWVSFAVVMALSIIFLIVFGQLSGTQEAKPIYRSLTRIAIDFSRAFIKDRMRTKKSQ